MRLCQKKILRLYFLVATFFIVGCPTMSKDLDTIAEFYGFPLYPDAKHLCQKRVYVSGSAPGHLTWDAFVSDSSPSTIIEHFLLKLGEGGFSRESEKGTWRLPAGAECPSRVLDIFPVGKPGPHMECNRTLPAGSRSILIYSRMP